MIHYLFVFIAALLVDIIPFIGPPAWVAMVFFQIKYDLNIWWVLVVGVAGSTIGRYVLSMYMPLVFGNVLNKQKQADIEFIGNKLGRNSWEVKLFVFLYTLVPLPSTPLFTAAGMARIKPIHFIPSFILGKFSSDMLMVVSGDYAARNTVKIMAGLLSWQSVAGVLFGILVIVLFIAIDWRNLLQNKRFTLHFNFWKR